MAQRKPYNPNTAYGRRKLREQFQRSYEQKTESEKQELDNSVTIARIVLFIVIVIGYFLYLYIKSI